MAFALVMLIVNAMVTSRLTLRESRQQIRQFGEVKAGPSCSKDVDQPQLAF